MTFTYDEPARREDVRTKVREGYGLIAAAKGGGCCGPSSCCASPGADAFAAALGYESNDLAALPDGANLGLSCGNPVALAGLRPGEVVLDLGAGGGFDVFIAARKVGPAGRAIGVDMTPEMIALARRNAAAYRERTGLDNAEFRLGEIEHLPVADSSVDVVISNCVINLSPDKPQVYREIARVLRPGGRIAVSDIVLKRPLPAALREDTLALVGCVAGALPLDDLRGILAAAGLMEARFEEKPAYVEAMQSTKSHIAERVAALLEPGATLADYIASMNITARKEA